MANACPLLRFCCPKLPSAYSQFSISLFLSLGAADNALPYAVLAEIVDSLLALDGVCRVVYDLTSKPPATTEWE